MDATAQATGPVLVGVDGSMHNASAVAWAAAEAASRGGMSSPGAVPLVLVHDAGGSASAAGRAIVERAAAEAERLEPDLRPVRKVVRGSVGPGQSLRRATEAWVPVSDEDGGMPLLVVGRRGSGAIPRVRLGTTARHLAQRPGPVTVVVPGGWIAEEVSPEAPVVVDVGDVRTEADHRQSDADGVEQALGLALARALRLGRRVLAVGTWSVSAAAAQVDRAIRVVWDEHAALAERGLEEMLAPWRAAYPSVELMGVPTDRHPVSAVLGHADGAELLVVPRGDRASALVEYAECPVTMV